MYHKIVLLTIMLQTVISNRSPVLTFLIREKIAKCVEFVDDLLIVLFCCDKNQTREEKKFAFEFIYFFFHSKNLSFEYITHIFNFIFRRNKFSPAC